jgi:hypothetical protein
MVLYADDTSIIITDRDKSNFTMNLNCSFKKINTWFSTNLLILNLKKTQYLKLGQGVVVRAQCTLNATVTETKFLGLCIDDTLTWKRQIEQIVNKMATCYALRNIKHIVSTQTLKLIYFVKVHSVSSYGTIFWGSSTSVHKVFIMQKRIIRIITNTKPRESFQHFQDDGNNDTILTVHIFTTFIYN